MQNTSLNCQTSDFSDLALESRYCRPGCKRGTISRKLSVVCVTLLSFFISSFCLAGGEDGDLLDNFRTAPFSIKSDPLPLKGMPLWHTNGPLTSDLIREFFVKGRENGFGGYAFLPLSKTSPKHLSNDYIRYFGEVLDNAKRNDMKIIFYDDIDFPSGSAGRTIHQRLPEHTLKRLDKLEWTVDGPKAFSEKLSIPLAAKAIYGSPAGVLQGAVALNCQTFERIDITDAVQNGTISWTVPEGKWRIFVFVCLADKHILIDYMSPEAVREFIKLTYEPFYRQFPEHFGTTIPICFFDDITNTQTEGSRNWTPGFGKRYRELWKRNPVLDYPALFYPIGKETASARYRLWTTRNTLFAEGYPKIVHEWCREHKILSSGHPQGPYVIEPIDMSGDAMLTHEYSDSVLFDSIHYYGHGRDGFKIPTSAADNMDKPVTLVEIYGNYRPNSFDDKMMYRSAMEIFCRGGNCLLPHGIWSDPKTVYIPPEISWRNQNLKGCLPEYGDYVSRVSLMLRHSRHVADIGILYPVDAMKAYFHFQFEYVKGDYPYGIYLPEETDYLAIGADLTGRIHRDFTFLHPKFIDSKCSTVQVEDRTLFRLSNRNNWEEYEVVVLPGANVISWANMRRILEFYESGGKVLGTTFLPTRSAEGTFDREVCAAVKKIFGIDPTTQAANPALKTGQEDICTPENFRNVRKINIRGEEPNRISGTVHYTKPIYAKNAIFLPQPTTELLKASLDRLIDVPDVKIVPIKGKPIPTLTVVPRWEYKIQGMLQYIHKVKQGRNCYYFANSSDEPVEFRVELRGIFSGLEIWDPHTGAVHDLNDVRVERKNGRPYSTFTLKLPAIKSLFIVEKL